MTPEEFKKLYLGEYRPHPFEAYTDAQLEYIKCDRSAPSVDRKMASKILQERERLGYYVTKQKDK